MKLRYYCSTVADGSMKSLDGDQSVPRANRIRFLKKHGVSPEDTTLLRLNYGDNEDFCRYKSLGENHKGDGILNDSTFDTDALVVTEPGHAILLPLADCIGAVIYDSAKSVLMVSHLGRHNLEQHGGTKCIRYLIDKHGVNPKDLKIWLSPSAGKDNYPLYAFANRGMQEVALEQFQAAGIDEKSVDVSDIDTTTDSDYYSHSEFLKGNRPDDGRFAIVAVLTP